MIKVSSANGFICLKSIYIYIFKSDEAKYEDHQVWKAKREVYIQIPFEVSFSFSLGLWNWGGARWGLPLSMASV